MSAATKPAPPKQALQLLPPAPVHVLMEDGPPRPRLDRALERDFLGRRYHMEQNPSTGPVPAPDPLWNGATEDERALLSTIDVLDDDDDDDTPIIRWNDPVAFVGRMIDHPVLALAILERIAQQDANDRAEFEATRRMLGFIPPAKRQKKKKVDDDDSDYSIMDEEGDDGDEEDPYCGKRGPGSSEELPDQRSESRKRSSSAILTTNESESSEQLTVSSAKSVENETQERAHHEVELVITGAVVQAQPKTPPVRLEAFIEAGGLMILSRFLLEASPSINAKVVHVARKMEPLLLPLLNLLSEIPFDLKAIKESRINKEMKSLKRDLDLARGSHLRVKQKLALDKLMDKWEVMASKAGDENPRRVKSVVDPFAELNAQLDDRLNLLESRTREGSPDEVPPWLAKIRAETTIQVPTKPNPSRASMVDLARKERENEKTANMRKDHIETQRKRNEFLQQLRAMKSTGMEAPVRRPATQGVSWADGHGRTSRVRIRTELEMVVEFNQDDMARLIGDKAKHDPTLL